MDAFELKSNGQVESIDLMKNGTLEEEPKFRKRCQCSTPHCPVRIIIRKDVNQTPKVVTQSPTKSIQCQINGQDEKEKNKRKKTIKVNLEKLLFIFFMTNYFFYVRLVDDKFLCRDRLFKRFKIITK